jgi:hypothetical protein
MGRSLEKYGISTEEARARRAAGFLWCGTCKRFRKKGGFYGPRNTSACKVCRKTLKFRKYNRDLYLKNAYHHWTSRLQSQFNISEEWYNIQLSEQGDVCATCKKPNSNGRRLAVDHDRRCCPGRKSCGKCVRGLLCHPCNIALERLESTPTWVSNAQQYLRAHTTETKS